MPDSTKTIAIRFTERERILIEGLAELRGMTVSDLVRELIGFGRQDELPARGRLHVVPTQREGRQAAACLP